MHAASFSSEMLPQWYKSWMGALLALGLSFLVMFPTLQNEWLNWDDDAYVLRNPMVWELDGEHVAEMFTTPEQVGLYHPLTMLTLAVDEEIWGKDAFGFHLSNLLFHLLNVFLVFLLLRRLARQDFTAILGAVLFGMHPMHVESVAWISTRKDVLYVAFFLLALLAYLRAIDRETRKKGLWWGLVGILFVGALLSKAIAFVFPVILLLLDYHEGRKWSGRVLLEKLPFFLLSGIALYVATLGQQSSDSMMGVDEYPLWKTAFIGSRNFWLYLGKLILPLELSPFHPFPFQGSISIPAWYYLTAVPILAALGLAWRYRLQQRQLVFGFLFFLICIGPFLQILPYGKAIHAERYTYLSYVGLFYLLGTLLYKGWERGKGIRKWTGPGLAILWIGFLGLLSWRYIPHWKDGESLWTRVIEQYPDHYWGYMSRGQWFGRLSDRGRAISDLNHAIQLNAESNQAFYERAVLLDATGDWKAAERDYDRVIALGRKVSGAYVNRGLIKAKHYKDMDAALADFNAAAEADPNYALAYLNRGLILRGQGKLAEAEADYTKAIELEPWNTIFLRYRGSFYQSNYQLEQAEADFGQATIQEPNRGENWYLRGKVREQMGNIEGARSDYERAGSLNFRFPQGFIFPR